MQIFTKSSNQWAAKELDDEMVARFRASMIETGINCVVAHDSYLINLASPNNDLREKSFHAFLDEMDRCRKLGIKSLIMHPGSHTGSGEEEGIRTISAEFRKLLTMSGMIDMLVFAVLFVAGKRDPKCRLSFNQVLEN